MIVVDYHSYTFAPVLDLLSHPMELKLKLKQEMSILNPKLKLKLTGFGIRKIKLKLIRNACMLECHPPTF